MSTSLRGAFAVGSRQLEAVLRDLRQSVRSLRRKPGILVVSALSLGLGISVNATLYMGISKIYTSQPTMHDPNRVVGVELGTGSQLSYPDYEDLLRSRIFSGVLGFRATTLNLGYEGAQKRVETTVVTGNYFDVLGISAGLGQTFSAANTRPESKPRVAVATYGFWRDHLRSNTTAVGATLLLDGESFTLLGVLPDSYRAITGWRDRGLYVPISELTLPSIDDRVAGSLTVLARLKPNQSVQQAEQAVKELNDQLEDEFPHRILGEEQQAAVFPAQELQFRRAPAQSLLMKIAWAAAVSVLLIACVNVTGLLLARATDRQGELAIRGALGAGRMRIAQFMFLETFLVVMTAAAVGLPVASLLNRIPMPPPLTPIQGALALDSRVLPYVAGLIVVATMLCGLMPVLRMRRSDLTSHLGSGGRFTPRSWLREVVVATQVAMSFVLIVVALFCVRSQIHIAHQDLGFDVDHGLVAQLGLSWNQYPGQERVALADRLTKRIEQIPGVSSVSVADLVPLGGNGLIKSFHPAGRNDTRNGRPDTFSVGPEYFRTLGIQLFKGREFSAVDRAGATPVAIVNETYARTHFSRMDIAGESISTAGEPDARVIGIAHDYRIDTIGERPRSVVYYAFAQHPSDIRVHVRCAGPPDTLLPGVARAVAETDGTIPVTVETLRDATDLELTMRRAGITLMGGLGAVGLFLATIGLYCAMAYVAATRTGEVAIRMTLGASRNHIRWGLLRRSLIVVLPGVALGTFVLLAVMPAFRTFLAGVSPFDPVPFVSAAAIFVLTGLAAGYIPAQRNSRLDPMQVLRQQ